MIAESIQATAPSDFIRSLGAVFIRKRFFSGIIKAFALCHAAPSHTYQNNDVIRIWHRQINEKYIHAISVAIRHNQEAVFTADRFNCSVNISVFSNVMARNRRTNTLFCTSSILVCWFDQNLLRPETSSVLWNCGIFRCFLYDLFHFFEASIASGFAFFGCRFLGTFFSIHVDEALNISVLNWFYDLPFSDTLFLSLILL